MISETDIAKMAEEAGVTPDEMKKVIKILEKRKGRGRPPTNKGE
jgi:hypothetical protein